MPATPVSISPNITTLLPDDTIAAVASAAGPAGRGILRISGAAVREVLASVFTPDDPPTWNSASSALRHTGQVHLDTAANTATTAPAAALFWPTSRSYTGQPAAEIHVAGSPPLLERLLERLLAAGARAARPGEFTLRAFLAGRLDLVQAEAVLGVIEAEDHRELEVALRQLAGGLSGPLAEIRLELIDLLADLEAGLDFAEEDIQFVSPDQLAERLAALRQQLATVRQQADTRSLSTGRRRVVLAGLPNAGKSTLLNALAPRPAALTSPTPGTTRDFLEADIELEGLRVTLVDTAGWDDASEGVPAAAGRQRESQLEPASLILWCTAANTAADTANHLTEARAREQVSEAQTPVLAIITKSDLAGPGRIVLPDDDRLRVCSLTGDGLPELRQALTRTLSRRNPGGGDLVGSTAARAAESLRQTDAALGAAAEVRGEELVAVELREALAGLAAILGTVYTDDVLDRVFSRFCIGK